MRMGKRLHPKLNPSQVLPGCLRFRLLSSALELTVSQAIPSDVEHQHSIAIVRTAWHAIAIGIEDNVRKS
jgi:hypothetical protein